MTLGKIDFDWYCCKQGSIEEKKTIERKNETRDRNKKERK